MLLNQPENQYRHGRSINLQNLTHTTGKRFFSRFSDWERCGHMSGLFECSRTTAGLDEIREESG